VTQYFRTDEGRSRFGSGALASGIALMRPEQWIKNSFVLVPLFFSGKMTLPLVAQALAGAVAFSLLSSAVYIFNDLRDLEADRLHLKKRTRPLPAGRISLNAARLLSIALVLAAGALTILAGLPLQVFPVYAAYAAINIVYSLRLLAGSIIDGELLSPWIVACTGLVSLMLVVGKRRADIANALDETGRRRSLAHYSVAYLDQLTTLLAGATVVTYLLFCISDYAMQRFGVDVSITAVFVLFGVFRFLQIIAVQAGGDSPTDMVLRDGPIRTTIVLWLLSFFVIIYVVR
jgi:4-hydroxybenzoate polyprenyltransferase